MSVYKFVDVDITTDDKGVKTVSVRVECESNARGGPSYIGGLDSTHCIWITVPYSTSPESIVKKVRAEIASRRERKMEEIVFLHKLQEFNIKP